MAHCPLELPGYCQTSHGGRGLSCNGYTPEPSLQHAGQPPVQQLSSGALVQMDDPEGVGSGASLLGGLMQVLYP